MQLYAIRRRNGWKTNKELEATVAQSIKVGSEMSDRVRWIRSYVLAESDGTLGMICIYEALDSVAIDEHAKRVGIPADGINPILQTVINGPDPH